MHHAGLVRRDQDAGDLLGHPHLQGAREPLVDRGVEAAPLHELEDEQVALAALEVVVDLADVGVAQAGEGARLAEEPRPRLGLESVAGVYGLERDPPLEGLVEPDVDGAHPAAGQVALDPDVADPLPDEILVCHGLLAP